MHNKPRVIEHAGIAIDLAQVKCFKLSQFDGIGKPNTLTIEFKTRFEYFWNPGTEKFEKEEINEKTEVEFPSWDTAKAYSAELEEIWQSYLEEQL